MVLGDGNVDFVTFAEQFRKLCPKSSMQLEIITGRPPRVIPYLEADFWKAFPKAAGGGVRALRGAGQERPSVHGGHGD